MQFLFLLFNPDVLVIIFAIQVNNFKRIFSLNSTGMKKWNEIEKPKQVMLIITNDKKKIT